MNYDLTIIVPVYNEEDNMPALEERLGKFLPTCKCSACVLFVDDGSKDKSLPLIKDICARNKDFYYISFAQNRGLSAAMKAGIDHATSPYVGYIDADPQTAPEDFNLLVDYIKDYPLVMGIRANRKDTGFKKLQSKIANGFRRMMTHDGVQDTGCPPQNHAHRLCQARAFLYWHASILARADIAARRRQGQASAGAPFPAHSGCEQIPPVEPLGSTLYGLLRLSVDEETLYQLHHRRSESQIASASTYDICNWIFGPSLVLGAHPGAMDHVGAR